MGTLAPFNGPNSARNLHRLATVSGGVQERLHVPSMYQHSGKPR